MFDPEPWLEKLDAMIDPVRVANARELQEKCWRGEKVERIPLILGSLDDMSKERNHFTDWPLFPLDETLRDPAKMLMNELIPAYEGALIGDDKMYTIRANYGVAILPSLFGCAVHQEADEYPWIDPLESEEEIRLAVDRGVPYLKTGLMAKVLETQDYFRRMLDQYPNLKNNVHIALCDIQGPFNLAFELVGSRIFYDVVDNPSLVHELMNLTTETYIAAARLEKEILGEPLDSGFHYQYRLFGGVRICEDNALSMSPAMYDEFCRLYNERALAPFGGGYMLVCGRFDHVRKCMLDTSGVRGLCYWSETPEDFEEVYAETRKRGVCLLWYRLTDPEKMRDAETGLIIKARIRSVEDGKQVLREWAK